jgi:hypothetical protein
MISAGDHAPVIATMSSRASAQNMATGQMAGQSAIGTTESVNLFETSGA